jgi:hypothetical protein
MQIQDKTKTYNKFLYEIFMVIGLLGLINIVFKSSVVYVISIILIPIRSILPSFYGASLGIISIILDLALVWLIIAYAIKKYNYKPF